MLSGNKPLPELMWTQDLCRYMASLGHNELTQVMEIILQVYLSNLFYEVISWILFLKIGVMDGATEPHIDDKSTLIQ